jgi:hypothetical protein
MLGSWSYIEEFQFSCWSQCCGYESIFSDSDPKIFFSGFGFGFRFYATYTVRYGFTIKCFKWIVSQDLEVCFWPFDRSEVPTLMEPVRLILKFRFHVNIF